MLIKKLALLLVVSICFVGSALAASKSRELALDGNYIKVQGLPTAYLLNTSLGQYVTPQLAFVTSLSTQKNFAYSATTIGVGGKYYFMDGFKGDLIPFAGVGIGLRLADTPTDSNHGSTQYDGSIGVAYFLSDSTTLDAKAKFMTFNDDSSNIFLLTAGFSQRF